jgi:hypothetical protein
MPKYQAIDSQGRTHKRNSSGSGRTYSHCVVHSYGSGGYRAEWRRTLELARKVKPYHGCTVEIIEAQEV